MAKLAKTDARYWQDRIFFPGYTTNGEKKWTKEYAVRLQHRGRRETFPLETANKAVASTKARNLFEHLRAHGWEKTFAKFKSSTLHRTPKPFVWTATADLILDRVATLCKRTNRSPH